MISVVALWWWWWLGGGGGRRGGGGGRSFVFLQVSRCFALLQKNLLDAFACRGLSARVRMRFVSKGVGWRGWGSGASTSSWNVHSVSLHPSRAVCMHH